MGEIQQTNSAKEYFRLRLSELIDDNGMTQAGLAKKMNTTPQAISSYVTGKTTPDYDMLCNIAEFFGVSTDYLLGVKHTLTEDENTIYEEMLGSTDGVKPYLLREFRQFANVNKKLCTLYGDAYTMQSTDTSLLSRYIHELHCVRDKYETITQIFGSSGASLPEPGVLCDSRTEFLEHLGKLMEDESFHLKNTEPDIISELIRMQAELGSWD